MNLSEIAKKYENKELENYEGFFKEFLLNPYGFILKNKKYYKIYSMKEPIDSFDFIFTDLGFYGNKELNKYYRTYCFIDRNGIISDSIEVNGWKLSYINVASLGFRIRDRNLDIIEDFTSNSLWDFLDYIFDKFLPYTGLEDGQTYMLLKRLEGVEESIKTLDEKIDFLLSQNNNPSQE